MVKRRDPLDRPRDYVMNWPTGMSTADAGIVKSGAPLPVYYMLHIARTAREAMRAKGLLMKDITTMSNLENSTVRLVLNGYVWPDVVSITRLEQAIGVTLWPTWGDTTVQDLQTQVDSLETIIRRLRSNARKKAAANNGAAKKVTARKKAPARKKVPARKAR